jgi:4-amino-4-deoxy-L-arabinose transferase-like glycosyltransferase
MSIRTDAASPRWRPWHAPALAGLSIVVWVAWAVLFNGAQFGDNIEQFDWAHSLEWGYHKHPPLPTWLLALLMRAIGPSRHAAHALAAAALLGTGWLTWLIARRLLGESIAAAALLLWPLQQTFAQRAQLYNHNTVLVLCVAACVWCSLKATEDRARSATGWWLAVGVCAGLAFLSKYQAAVPLASLLVTLHWAGHLGSGRRWRGVALAVLVAVLVCLPHALWVVHHDFSTLRYAAETVEESGLKHRLATLLSFVANQLRMIAPMLLALAVFALMARWRPSAAVPRGAAPKGIETGKWLIGLVWLPAALLVLLDLAGVSLRNHWGVQTFQFLSLWVAWRLVRHHGIDLPRLARIAIAVQLLGLALYAAQQRDPQAQRAERRLDTEFPAQRLADAAVARWNAATSCPLRFTAGDPFLAGLVSVYSGLNPAVFYGDESTPWISARDLAQAGALFAVEARSQLPAGVTVVELFKSVPDEAGRRAARTVYLGVLPPAADCK